MACLSLTNDILLHFKRKDSTTLSTSANNSLTRSTKETTIMNPIPPHTTETTIDNLDMYIIPYILENLKSKHISLVEEQLRWTTKLIFETIIDDPNSVPLCVNMCYKLCHKIEIFNRCLIDFCQKEFECHHLQVPDYQRYDVHLQAILTTRMDAINQKVYCSMLEKTIEKQSHRSIAIVNFICELYRHCMIPEKVIECCLITLLSPEILSEVSLLCVRCIINKFDQSLTVPVHLFECLTHAFNVFSTEMFNQYTEKVRWMIIDTMKLIQLTKQLNSRPINNSLGNVPNNLNTVQHEGVLNHGQYVPNSKANVELLNRLQDLQTMYKIYIFWPFFC